jgi:MoaA/NifB/PqqE/SkfB family radical SAM enzyme
MIALSSSEMRIDDAPPLVIWETSQACDLACSNCRPSAAPRRHSSELTTEEGIRLLEQVRAFGNPLMVLTGGDPLKRPDLFTLIRKSVALGLRTNIRVSATPLLTREAILRFKQEGVERMAIGLDGWDAPSHDGFRGIPGTFDCAMNALRVAREIGLDTQIQTMVTAVNRYRLDEIAVLVEEVKACAWSLALAGDEFEKVFRDIYEISQSASFDVKTEDARYRHYLVRRLERLGELPEPVLEGVSRGRGFIFISHTGEIHPGGFLSVSAGNVRYDSLVEVYRNSSLFSILCGNEAARGSAAQGPDGKYAEVRGLALML